jgi:hypothetical protein
MGASQSQSSPDSSVAVAEMFMCGRDVASCRSVVVPKQVKKLIFDGIYQRVEMIGQMLKVMQTIHHGRACIFSNSVTFDLDSGKVKITLEGGRANQKIVDLSKTRFSEFVAKCDRPAVGVQIGFKGHANMLVFNKVRKTVEHFEPHGESASHLSDAQNAKLAQMIKDTFLCTTDCAFPGFEYVPPSAACPMVRIGSGTINSEFGVKKTAGGKLGMQSILNKTKLNSRFAGTCVMWSLWFLHVRLLYPDLAPSEVMGKALSMAFAASDVPKNVLMQQDDDLDVKHQDLPFCTKELMFDGAEKCESSDDTLRSKCPSECKKKIALASGGQTLEDFIVQFTQKLIAHIDLTISKESCISMDKKKDSGFVTFCEKEPPQPDDATIVIYTANKDFLKFAHYVLSNRRRLVPTLDFMIHFMEDPTQILSEAADKWVKTMTRSGNLIYLNGNPELPTYQDVIDLVPIQERWEKVVWRILRDIAPVAVKPPKKKGYTFYGPKEKEGEPSFMNIDDFETMSNLGLGVEFETLDPDYYTAESIDDIYALMPADAVAGIKKGTNGAAFFNGVYIGLGVKAISHHATIDDGAPSYDAAAFVMKPRRRRATGGRSRSRRGRK